MDHREERIRQRAYEIWEREGRTGNPEDHWLEAEREVQAEARSAEPENGTSEATLEDASPVETVEALEAATNGATKRKRQSRSIKA